MIDPMRLDRIRMAFVVALFTTLAGAVGGAFAQSDPRAIEVLEQVREARLALPPLAMHVELARETSHTNWPEQDPEQGTIPGKFVADYFRDGERVDYRFQGGTLQDKREVINRRTVWDGERYWYITRPDTRLYPDDELKATISENNKTKEPYSPGVVISTELDGVFGVNRAVPIHEIMLQSSSLRLLPSVENVDGFPCRVIEAHRQGQSPRDKDFEYKYTIWIDPEHGYNLRRAVVERMDTKDRKQQVNPRTGLLGTIAKETTGKLEDVSIEKVGDHWIATHGVYTSTLRYAGGAERVVKDEIERTVSLEPDFESAEAFHVELPEGTRVFLDHAPGLTYRWSRGKPVVDLGDALTAEIDENIKALEAPASGESAALAGAADQEGGTPQSAVSGSSSTYEKENGIILSVVAGGLVLLLLSIAIIVIRRRGVRA